MPQEIQRQLKEMAGNLLCVDCGAPQPSWASVSYGTLFCLGEYTAGRAQGGRAARTALRTRAGCRTSRDTVRTTAEVTSLAPRRACG